MDRVLKSMLISLVLLLSIFLLMGCRQEIQIDEASIVAGTGTVTDRAMASEGSGSFWDNSYPYLTIEFEDGTEICVWNKLDVNTDKIETGDTVEIIYGCQTGSGHWILIHIEEVE